MTKTLAGPQTFSKFLRITRPSAPVGLCLLVLVFQVYPGWYTTPTSSIDSWIYWGTAEAVGYSAGAFGETYYFRRWPLWVPQWLLRRFLGPLETQMVLRSIIFTSIFAVINSIVAVGKQKTQHATASAAMLALALLGSGYFVYSWSMSYHQGLGTLLFLTALRIALQRRERFTAGSAAAFGAVLLLTFVTYPFTVLLFPALIWVYLSALSAGCLLTRFHALRTEWILVGGLSVMITDFALGWLLVGGWNNLFLYNLRVGRDLPNYFVFSREVLLSNFLGPAGSILAVWAATLALLCAPRFRDARLAGFLGLTALSYFRDLARAEELPHPHTNIYLYSAVFVCLALLVNQTTVGRNLSVGGLVVVIAGTTFFWWDGIEGTKPLVVVSLLVIAVVALSPLSRSSLIESVLAFGAHLAFVAFVFGLATTPWVAGMAMEWDREVGDPRRHYENLTKDHHYITLWGQENEVRMFLIDARPNAGWGSSVSALYGMYSGLRLGFNGEWNCSWVGVAAGPTAAIAVIGNIVEMIDEVVELEVAPSMQAVDSSEPLEIMIERAALDSSLRACEGVDPWNGNMRLLDVRSGTASSASIKVYGYR